jgi:hypothetical protein
MMQTLWQRFHPVAVTFGVDASVRRVSLVLCPNTFHSHKLSFATRQSYSEPMRLFGGFATARMLALACRIGHQICH